MLRRAAVSQWSWRASRFPATISPIWSFASLVSVSFAGCDLAGIDLHGATFDRCAMIDCTLDDARGVTTLAGIIVPRQDLIGPAPVMATALGLRLQPE